MHSWNFSHQFPFVSVVTGFFHLNGPKCLADLGVEEGGCSQWRWHFFLFSKFCKADLGVTVNVFMRNTLSRQLHKRSVLLRKNKTSKQPKKESPHTPSLLLMCPHVKSGFYLTETSELGDKKPRKLFLMCGKCSALATENHPAEYIGAAVWNRKETPKLNSG